jgi:sugar lactone lactonase YvrE
VTTRSWIRRLFPRTPSTVRKTAACRRPWIEELEDRLTPAGPQVVTGAAIITSAGTGATLNGTVNPEGSTVTALFQYSTDPTFIPTVASTKATGFINPHGVAVNAAGDLFVADSNNNAIMEVLPSGAIRTYASGFNLPTGVALDAAGDLFVADAGSGSVKEVRPNGTIQTYASGFSSPQGVAADAAGNVFVADYGNNAVKEVLPNGTIKTIGSGFFSPHGVAVDAAGDVFVADRGNTAVKEVLPDGTVRTLGSGFVGPNDVAVDAAGDVFVTDLNPNVTDLSRNAVKEILPSGTIKTISFSAPLGVAVDAAGDVFVTDINSDRVVQLSPPTVTATPSPLSGSQDMAVSASVTGLTPFTVYYYRVVATGPGGTAAASARSLVSVPPPPTVATAPATAVAPTGATLNGTVNPEGSTTTVRFQYSTDPTFTPTVASTLGSGFSLPDGVAVDAVGDIFVADAGHNAVKEVLPDGTIRTLGSGFNIPAGVAVDAAGDVFVADYGNNAIKEVLPGGAIQTIGSGFSNPFGVAVDAAGDVFVADTFNNAVKEVLPNGVIKTIGSGFKTPYGVALDAGGDVFVADYSNHAVKEVLPDGTIRTLGSGISAVGVAVDAAGDVFATDYGNSLLEEILPNGTMRTLGSGFRGPRGVAVDGAGDVCVADWGNNRIVEMSLPTVAATPAPLTGYQATAVSASLTGLAPNTGYYYRVVATGPGGTVAAPASSFLTVLTVPPPTVATAPATAVGPVGATLNGTVNPEGASATALFQYSTDPTFTPTVATTIASGFNYPTGVAVDAAGDVFVADNNNNAVKEFLLNGTIKTIGSGFNNPEGVAVDAAGDVFVADLGNNAVKELLPNGTIKTIGSVFINPSGVAVDAAGDVFVINFGSQVVEEVLPDGTIRTIGSGFGIPFGVAVDAADDVFVADRGSNAVEEFLPNGAMRTIGSGFYFPQGVAVDAAGDVFVADSQNNAVKEVLPDGTIRTLGSGFDLPTGVAVDAAGDVFVTDTGHNRVVELSLPTVAATPAPLTGSQATAVSASLTGLAADTVYYYRAVATGVGGTVAAPALSFRTLLVPPAVVTAPATEMGPTGATLHGTVNPEGSTATALFQYSTDPTFTPASTIGSGFDRPDGVAVDAAGDVFVANFLNNTVEEVLPNGTIRTIGSGFNLPDGVAVDGAGDIFVADAGNNAVKEVLPNGTIQTIGSGLFNPNAVAVDGAGDVFVADTYNNAVKEILPNGTIKTLGSGYNNPHGVAVDGAGDVFVADTYNNAVKEILPDGTIKTLGSGFSIPTGVAVDGAGDVFVADFFNNAVKEILPDGTIRTLGSGFSGPESVTVDAAGDVFVADTFNNRVVELLQPPTVAATPSPLTGALATAVSANLTGLTPDTVYYYRVVASGPGGRAVDSSVQSFTTQVATSLANLAGGSIPFGTGSVNLSGQLVTTPGTSFPTSSVVTITIDGVAETAALNPDGSFQLAYQFSQALHNFPLGVTSSPYTITYAYTDPSGVFAPASDSSQTLTITKAAPTVRVADAGGTYNGGAFAATATVAGVVPSVDNSPAATLEGVAPTLSYYSGTYTSLAQLAGLTPLGGAPVNVGSYTVLATFAGSADYGSAQALADFTIATPTFNWTGAVSTDWNAAGNWTDINDATHHAVPGPGDIAVIGIAPNGPILTANTTIAGLQLHGGSLTLDANLTDTGNLFQGGTTVSFGADTDILTVDGNFANSGGAFNLSKGTLVLAGTSAQTVTDTAGLSLPNLSVTGTGGVSLSSSSTVLVTGLSVAGNLTLNANLRDTGNFTQGAGSIGYGANGILLILQGDVTRTGGAFLNTSGPVVGNVLISGQVSRHVTDTSGTALPNLKITNDNVSGVVVNPGSHVSAANLTLAAGSTLVLQGNSTLSANGGFTDSGKLVLSQPTPGGTAPVAVSGTLTLAGTTAFDLTVGAPARGTTYNFIQYGSLTDNAGVMFIIRGNGPFDAAVSRSSTTLTVTLLGGDTFIWTGGISSDWFTAANWTDASGFHAVPGPTDTAIIHGAPFDPVLTASATVANLRVTIGFLTLDASLTDTGTYSQDSGFVAFGADADQLIIAGNVTRTGGMFLGAAGTVVFDGATQSVSDTSGHPFGWNMIVDSGTTVTIQQGSTVLVGNDFTNDGTVNLGMATPSSAPPLVVGHNLVEGSSSVFNFTLGEMNGGLVYIFLTFGGIETTGATFTANAGTVHHNGNNISVAT